MLMIAENFKGSYINSKAFCHNQLYSLNNGISETVPGLHREHWLKRTVKPALPSHSPHSIPKRIYKVY